MQTLTEAKKYLRENWEKGVACPCCNQLVKKYKRPAHASMVRALVNLYKLDKRRPDYYHVTEIAKGIGTVTIGDYAKFAPWGLIQQKPNDGTEKGKTSGYWKITEKGKLFVENKVSIHSHIVCYNRKTLGFTGEQIYISSAFSKHFDYNQLMSNDL